MLRVGKLEIREIDFVNSFFITGINFALSIFINEIISDSLGETI